MKNMEGKYLITTEDWFYAPDGMRYRAAWGNIEIFEDNILGIKTNRNSTNWYIKVGDKDNHIIVAGCRVHYAVKCNEKPYNKSIFELVGENKQWRETHIYIAEKE